jgi:hypothetical protein
MKKASIKYYLAAFILTSGLSCQKVIDLNLRNNSGQLVIEGNITNLPGSQYIKLSQNVAFTSTNTYPPVSGAVVTVGDTSGNTYHFTEGPAGTYSASSLTGMRVNKYTMTVKTNGTTYTAISTMPQAVTLDSVTAENDLFNNGKNRRNIVVHFLDPPGIANQYRFVLTVNGVQVKAVFAFDDDFFDGRYVNLELLENDIDIYPGDTVTVGMQCIDKPMYTYWFSLMQQGDGPGGGVSPSNPPTNITPASLGYFSAHTTQTLSILVK